MTGKVQFAQTRSSAKWPTVVSEIRRRIVAGELSPGARLPTRPQLSREFRVSQSTAQAVLDELSRARFIETRGRHGTFVAENPPHLSHYAIVFPQLHPGNAKSSLFYDAIWQAARALPLPEGCDAAMYEASVERGWDAGYRKLVHDVRHDGVAGLIFATTPFELQGTPLLNQPGIPRVAIMEPLEGINLPRVYPDFSKWYPLAFDAVQQTGRRRLGVITPTAFAETADDLVAKEAGPRGLTTSGNWTQFANTEWPLQTARIVRLMLNAPADQRPNVLLVTDDNLLAPVLDGIAAAGLRPGHDVVLVTHWNFPQPKPAGVPLIRVGFDVPTILRHCIESITKQRQGEAVPAETLVPPTAVAREG